jgi:hypothetical protein
LLTVSNSKKLIIQPGFLQSYSDLQVVCEADVYDFSGRAMKEFNTDEFPD